MCLFFTLLLTVSVNAALLIQYSYESAHVCALWCGGFVVLTVVSLWLNVLPLHAHTKTMASISFIALALRSDALATEYGTWVLGGLVLGAFGDVFLIVKNNDVTFLLGLVSFLLGHILYVYAFIVEGLDSESLKPSAIVVLAASAPLAVWVLPKVSTPKLLPVLAYVVTISVMVICAMMMVSYPIVVELCTGVVTLDELPYLDYLNAMRLIGAILFYLSDVCVARQVFVHKSLLNPTIGLPLYYLGQVVLAHTVL